MRIFVNSTGLGTAYYDGMSDYDVRALESTYAPTIGETEFWDVIASDWRTSDPANLDAKHVIHAWSGGCGDDNRTLYIHGGGHNATAYNGVIKYDFTNRSGVPGGFSLESGSLSDLDDITAPNPAESLATYDDGKPSSVHTYDGVVVHDGTMVRFGGSPFNLGAWLGSIWVWTGSAWSEQTATTGTAGNHKLTAYDSATGKVLILTDSNTRYYVHDIDADTTTSEKFITGGGASDGILIHDAGRDRVYQFGNGNSDAWDMNWSTDTLSNQSTLTFTGDDELMTVNGKSGFYDSVRDCIWLFGGNPDGTNNYGYSNIYEIDGADLASGGSVAVTKHALSATMASSSTSLGSWKRFVWMADVRCIGFVTEPESPAYVIKVPNS